MIAASGPSNNIPVIYEHTFTPTVRGHRSDDVYSTRLTFCAPPV